MPAGSDDVVMLRAGGLIVSDSAAVAETDALSVTRTVKLLDPAVAGRARYRPARRRDSIPPAAIRSPPTTSTAAIPPAAPSACE